LFAGSRIRSKNVGASKSTAAMQSTIILKIFLLQWRTMVFLAEGENVVIGLEGD